MDTKLKKSNKPVFITAYLICVISFLASIVCIIGAARLNSYSGYMDPYFLESNGFSSLSEFLEQQGGSLSVQIEALEEHMKIWIILAIAAGIIALLCEKLPFMAGADFTPDIAKVTDSKKVSDHHAIIPTMELAKTDLAALPESEKNLKHVEDTVEQNDNNFDGIINNTPTVDELEAKVKAGETISLVDLANAVKADRERGKEAKPEKKPSIRAQLRADKEKAQKKNAKQKSQDLERS